MNLLMNLDLLAPCRRTDGRHRHGRPRAAEFRRAERPHAADSRFISYEHWISYQTDSGFRIRAGRFLPAYGVRFADHTTYTRKYLDLDRNNQVYGSEVSATIDSFAGSGDGEPRQGRSHPARPQASRVFHRRPLAVRSRAARDNRRLWPSIATRRMRDPQSGAAGFAFGFAPTSHVSRLDGSGRKPADEGRRRAVSWVVANETSVEVYRGIWLKVSPQFLTSGGAPGSSNRRRLGFSADLLPRTHWNVNIGVLPGPRVRRHHVDGRDTAAPVL